MEHDKVKSPTLFDWYGDGSQSIGTYKGYTATINYVSGDMVFILQVTMPTKPLSHITLDVMSYEEAKQLADLIIINYEAKKEEHKHRNEQFKRFMRNIGLPIDTIQYYDIIV